MEEKNFQFNIESGNEGGFAYNPEQQFNYQEIKNFAVDLEKANKEKESTLKNILAGNSHVRGLTTLIDSIESDTLNENELKKSLQLLPQAIAHIRYKYLHPIVSGAQGRIRYLIRPGSNNLKEYDVFIEADKIAKDLQFYKEKFPNDLLLNTEENKENVSKIISEFQHLINLYIKTDKAIDKSTGIEIEVRQKSDELTGDNFKNQVLALCMEANDILMDLESSLVSKNFSEMNSLVMDLEQMEDKEEILKKLTALKMLVESELG